MAKTFSFPHISLLFLRPSRALSLARTVPILLSRKPNNGVPVHPFLLVTLPQNSPFSTAPATPYPLQYELIHHRPAHQTQHHTTTRRRRGHKPLNSNLTDSAESELDQPEHEPSSSELAAELSFEDWVDKKLARKETERSIGKPSSEYTAMDKAKRKYYNKKRQRMYGTDSEDESRSSTGDGFVELKPEFVELKTLHKREEELYFYDTFAYPWEKDKHYKMVYHLEKKYFPEQCLDKAFLQPGELSTRTNEYSKKRREKNVLMFGRMTDGAGGGGGGGDGDGGKGTGEDDKGLIFFEKSGDRKSGGKEISEKKVEEFFNCLKKVPNKNAEVGNLEPFLASRSNGLPPTWDSPGGNVVLINKPKGWTSFTVCGKLRRLVKVKKVGHAGTLDPMATGLLIVCVGKATKIIDRYQGMVKGYTGVFRLGEATSTWDADSPVIQREPWEFIKDAEVQKVAASYLGEIWQVPPMFSAIKVGGERMYEKARRGESMELSPRRISIFQFEIERSLEDRQNLIFRVICSKGTYIRALCADFGKALGSCAHLTALRRESIGEYSADDAFEFHELEEEITKGYL